MNGVVIPWAGRIVVIAPECMGYRSMSVMAVLALVLVISRRPGLVKSLALFVSAAVIAVVGNLCRIGCLMLAMWLLPDAWYNPIHDSAGLIAIVIEAIILANVCDWLKSIGTKSKNQSDKKEQTCAS